ncbi:MAG: NAD-dependent epimerase/dehydratase family protein [Gammaproteobacteria bacterium]|nr:NAD-dependent epimerase/dehydratase family protein [Gammaproteobacteria bacterium]
METALILGISGNFGRHVARELCNRGYALKALVRKEGLVDVGYEHIEQVIGEVSDKRLLRQAAEGCDIVVYAVNPAGYDWEDKALAWLEVVAGLAEKRAMTLVFPGNVYVYDPADGPNFSEQSDKHPVSRLGEIRQQMEQRLQCAAQNGARVIIVRAGDFIGAGTASAWLPQLLKRSSRGYNLSLPGAKNLKHSWAYLPDLAQTVAALIEQRQSLSAFNEFHFKGYQCSLEQMASIIEQATSMPVRTRVFPWFVIRLMAPFSALYRGLYEMRYLWQAEINLCEEKLVSQLNEPLPRTPLPRALQDAGLIQAAARDSL